MMTIPPEEVGRKPHYLVDAAVCADRAWRLVAAHHLLTSRHMPTATMSIVGIDEQLADQLRIFATELGLSGLRIPDNDPPDDSMVIKLPRPLPPPTVVCELIALSFMNSVIPE